MNTVCNRARATIATCSPSIFARLPSIGSPVPVEEVKRNILLVFMRDISTTHAAHSRELNSTEENLVELVPIDPRQLVLAPHRETGSSSDADISGEGSPRVAISLAAPWGGIPVRCLPPFPLGCVVHCRLDVCELYMMSLTVALI